MDGIRVPTGWRKPRMQVYRYNQEFGGSYYQPMIEYIDTKERQGIFFERPTEQIHLPDPVEISRKRDQNEIDLGTGKNVRHFLTKAYAQQIKEQNVPTVKTNMKTIWAVTNPKMLPHSRSDNQQTFFDDVRLLKGEVPGRKQVNYYTTQLGVSKVGEEWRNLCTYNHVLNTLTGRYSCELSDLGLGGTPSGEKFYNPEVIQAVTSAIQ